MLYPCVLCERLYACTVRLHCTPALYACTVRLQAGARDGGGDALGLPLQHAQRRGGLQQGPSDQPLVQHGPDQERPPYFSR